MGTVKSTLVTSAPDMANAQAIAAEIQEKSNSTSPTPRGSSSDVTPATNIAKGAVSIKADDDAVESLEALTRNQEADVAASTTLSDVERVFGITVLLEGILLANAEQHAQRAPDGRLLAPVRELVRLLQVDSAFRSIIRDPPKLQRFVYSAAAKVFAIPELLNEILSYRAAYASTIIGHNDVLIASSLGLFPLQRVSHTFKNTIQGSKGFRQRMFLERQDNDSSTSVLQPLAPFEWLEHTFANNAYRTHPDVTIRDGRVALPVFEVEDDATKSELELRLYGNRKVDHTGRMLPKFNRRVREWLRPEASWRRMKLFCVATPDPVAIEQTFRPDIYHSRRVYEYKVEWIVDDTWTLGDMWDHYANPPSKVPATIELRCYSNLERRD